MQCSRDEAGVVNREGWLTQPPLHSPSRAGNAGKLKKSPFPDLFAVNLPFICIHISLVKWMRREDYFSFLLAAWVQTGKGHYPAS